MWQIRQAEIADVLAIHDSWLLTDFPDEGERALVARLGPAPWFAHLIAHGDMRVAEVDGQLCAVLPFRGCRVPCGEAGAG